GGRERARPPLPPAGGPRPRFGERRGLDPPHARRPLLPFRALVAARPPVAPTVQRTGFPVLGRGAERAHAVAARRLVSAVVAPDARLRATRLHDGPNPDLSAGPRSGRPGGAAGLSPGLRRYRGAAASTARRAHRRAGSPGGLSHARAQSAGRRRIAAGLRSRRAVA